MANDRSALTDALPKEIDFLLFHAAGVDMAVEAVQVEGILSREQAEQRAIAIGSLGKLLGREETVPDVSTKVLLFRDGDETCGVGINALDAMARVAIGTIQPLPELLSNLEGLRPFWGVIPQGNRVVFLIDLFRLKGLSARQSELFA